MHKFFPPKLLMNIIVLTLLHLFILYILTLSNPSTKPVNKNPIQNILIALPVIDRDHDIAPTVYNHIIQSISYTPHVKYSFLIVTRSSDIKSISFWKNKGHLIVLKHYTINTRHNFTALSHTFNTILEYSLPYDSLIIVESDILVNKFTFQKMLEQVY